MAALKEVRQRITSVTNTRKITSAMKLVASSKLHRAQHAIESMLPYERMLKHINACFIGSAADGLASPFAVHREVGSVLIIAYSSNSSLCGAFNANVIKALKEAVATYRKESVKVSVIAIGRKVSEAVRKMDVNVVKSITELLDNPTYDGARSLAEEVMSDFLSGIYDKVELIYNHFRSTAAQDLMHSDYLPLTLEAEGGGNGDSAIQADYIVEPNKEELISTLIPQSLHLHIYTVLLDSLASEHAARVVAMQIATDNADKLIQELTLMYNKSRQQAITTELLDIMGGSVK